MAGIKALPFPRGGTLTGEAIVPCVAAGAVAGLLTVALSLSFAMLIFAGPLEHQFATGAGFILFTAIVSGIIISLRSSFPGLVSTPQGPIAAILALAVAQLATETPPAALYPTVVAVLGLSSVSTGAILYGLGTTGLSNLVRFIPTPAIAGFLAGGGWLLVIGGLSVTAGGRIALADIDALMDAEVVARLVPGVALGLSLLVLDRRLRHPTVVPAALAVTVMLFHLVLAGLGVSADAARSAGFLLSIPADNFSWTPPGIELLGAADWSAVLGQGGTLAAIVVVTVVSILLTGSALELAAGRDVILDRELKAAGLANLACGLGGGMVGFHSPSLSALALRLNANHRLTGLLAAAVCALVAVTGTSALTYIPVPLLGGLLVFIGASLLWEWAWASRRRLDRMEHAIVLTILVCSAAIGYLEAVALGTAIAVVLFVVSYSRIGVIMHAATGAELRSNVDRSPVHERALTERGGRIHILRLQGYLFFGTAERIVQAVRARAADAARMPLGHVVLDCRRVSGIDASVVSAIAKLQRLGEREGFHLVLTGLSPEVAAAAARSGLMDKPGLRVFPSLDHGLEWCEDQLIGDDGVSDGPRPLGERLREQWPGPDQVGTLLRYLHRGEAPAGAALIRQGAPADDLFFIESGRVSALFELPSGETIRLRSMEAGTVVGELGFYTGEPRSAWVVADDRCVFYRLSRADLTAMAAHQPAVALTLHEYLAKLTATRLVATNQTLAVLRD